MVTYVILVIYFYYAIYDGRGKIGRGKHILKVLLMNVGSLRFIEQHRLEVYATWFTHKITVLGIKSRLRPEKELKNGGLRNL